ncbi:MAG: dienelactone hydrolase family protein [Bacteroidales bacterium]|nr:dienelactone hydrolase family protein [Bacteroidales bacterium]
MKRIFTVMALLAIAGSAIFAQSREFVCRYFPASNGVVLPYRILYPLNFDPESRYPMLVFLHGSGERGTDNQSQTFHGGKLFASGEELDGAIFIAPQCPWHDYWAPVNDNYPEGERFPQDAAMTKALEAVKELMDSFISLGFADPDRIYGTGLSMGGFGILDFTLRFPDYFTAVQPICGGVNIERCRQYRGRTAFRFFHGLADDVVPPSCSIDADEALKAAGAQSELITYPGVGHGSWNNAFAEPDFLSWFFRKH